MTNPFYSKPASVAVLTRSKSAHINDVNNATDAAFDSVYSQLTTGGLTGTSTTSVTVGTGSKTFTTAAGKQWIAGSFILVTRTSDSSQWMYGQITSYATTSLVINVASANGSGTYADWSISITPPLNGNLTALSSTGATLIGLDAANPVAGKYIVATGTDVFSVHDLPTAKNIARNRGFRLDRFNNGAAVSVNSSGPFYICDGYFALGNAADGVFSAQRIDAADGAYLRFQTTTADASIGASQTYSVASNIEGADITNLNWGASSAKYLTIRFMSRSSLTGTFGGFVVNASTRGYFFTFTVSSASTWEQQTITIPGDTSGTWAHQEGVIGLQWGFDIGSGSSVRTTAGSWQSITNTRGVTGSVSLIGTLNATLDIRNVDICVGDRYGTFELPSIQEEILRANRYLRPIVQNQAGAVMFRFGSRVSTNNIDVMESLVPPMARVPTLVDSSPTWNGASPGSNQLAAVDASSGSFITITGGLSLSLFEAKADFVVLRITAATSFSGTAGITAQLYAGASTNIRLRAEPI